MSTGPFIQDSGRQRLCSHFYAKGIVLLFVNTMLAQITVAALEKRPFIPFGSL